MNSPGGPLLAAPPNSPMGLRAAPAQVALSDEERLEAAEAAAQWWRDECTRWQAQVDNAEARVAAAEMRTSLSNARLMTAEATAHAAEAEARELEVMIKALEEQKQVDRQRAKEAQGWSAVSEKQAEMSQGLAAVEDRNSAVVARSIQAAQREAVEHIRTMQRLMEQKQRRLATRAEEAEKLTSLNMATASQAMTDLRKQVARNSSQSRSPTRPRSPTLRTASPIRRTASPTRPRSPGRDAVSSSPTAVSSIGFANHAAKALDRRRPATPTRVDVLDSRRSSTPPRLAVSLMERAARGER